MSKGPLRTIWVGLAMFVVGVGAGLSVAGLGLFRTFSAIEYADPAEKGARLYEGIAMAKIAVFAGGVVGALGAVVLFEGLVWMIVRNMSSGRAA